MKRMLRVLAVVAVGLGFLAGGGWAGRMALFWLGDTRGFLARSLPAEAEVVDYVVTTGRRSGSSQSRPQHYPVFRFRDAAGAEHRVRSRTGASAPAFPLGQAVPVRFDAADPERAEIAAWDRLWLGPILAGGLALGFGAAGLALLAGAWGMLRRRDGPRAA